MHGVFAHMRQVADTAGLPFCKITQVFIGLDAMVVAQETSVLTTDHFESQNFSHIKCIFRTVVFTALYASGI